MPEKIKIILADDHPIVRQGLRQVIEREPDLLVAAECGDGAAAIAAIEEHQPEAAILDVDMPHRTGFDVLRYLNESGAPTRGILLTVHDEAEFFHEARRLGARAYILKECAIEEIVTAIRAVAGGGEFASAHLNQHLLPRSTKNETSRLTSLTPTERAVLKLLADYKTTRDIADALFISPLTVKTHRRNISRKLEIEGANALMRFALDNKTLL